MVKKLDSIKNYRFDLSVNEERETIHIYLKHYMVEKDETVLISPDCVAPIELEGQVNMLIKELQHLKTKGKPYFTKWRKNKKYPESA